MWGQVRPRFFCAVFCLFIKWKEKIQHFPPIQSHEIRAVTICAPHKGTSRGSEGRALTQPILPSEQSACTRSFSKWHRNTNRLSIWQSSMSNSVHIIPYSPRCDHHDPRASLGYPKTVSEADKMSACWEYQMWKWMSFFRVCVTFLKSFVSPNGNLKTKI